MQLSCNVIKKESISSDAPYTINMPLPLDRYIMDEDDPEEEEETIDLDELIDNATKKAEEIVNEAQSRSSQIIEAARKEAERIKNDAYMAALKKGLNEGTQKGIEEGLKKTKDIRSNAEEVLNEAHKASREYIENHRKEIMELSFTIAEKVINSELSRDDSIIVGIANKAIENCVSKGQVVITVNPMDYANLDCRVDELEKSAGENAVITIIKDNDIRLGGCKVDTGLSTVDATIDGQLEKIKEALQG